MTIADWIFTSYSLLFCLGWCVFHLEAFRGILSLRLFEKEAATMPGSWPRLSVVIAARDEVETIEEAVSSLLRQDYPDLEIILVNDRSTDGTGEIIETLASRDSRIETVHVDSLPAGWIGKVHALHVGTQKSSGEWILYTDADVHFGQGTLRRAVALAIADRADHLVLIPDIETPSLLYELVTRSFLLMYLHGTRAANLGRPNSSAVVGAGAFNMVKRSALDKTGGFQWPRMEVVEDVGLGLNWKRAGAKSSLAIASEDISVRWYPSVTEMFKGFEKNMFASAHYSYVRMMFTFFFIWALVLSPAVSILYWRVPYLWISGAAAGITLVLASLAWKAKFKRKLLPSLLGPVGMLVLSLALLRSGILCMLRGGIIWRGTKYDIKELRAGQRVKW